MRVYRQLAPNFFIAAACVAGNLPRDHVPAIALEKPLLIAYLRTGGDEHARGGDEEIRRQRRLSRHGRQSAIFSPQWKRAKRTTPVIPIENSTRDPCARRSTSFVESDLKIVAQVHLEITHALISATPLEKNRKVYSKDQGCAQCRHGAAAPPARPANRRAEHFPRSQLAKAEPAPRDRERTRRPVSRRAGD